jgi:hypothetical protein
MGQLDLLAWSETTGQAQERTTAIGGSAEHERCTVCGRGLSSPGARKLGMGPVCAARKGMRVPSTSAKEEDVKAMQRAVFTYEQVGDVLCIEDTDRGMSVTNDAENVIATLGQYVRFSEIKSVIYRDTRGVWDEMIVRDGRFVSFRSVNERDREAALAKLAMRDRAVLHS